MLLCQSTATALVAQVRRFVLACPTSDLLMASDHEHVEGFDVINSYIPATPWTPHSFLWQRVVRELLATRFGRSYSNRLSSFDESGRPVPLRHSLLWLGGRWRRPGKVPLCARASRKCTQSCVDREPVRPWTMLRLCHRQSASGACPFTVHAITASPRGNISGSHVTLGIRSFACHMQDSCGHSVTD